MSWKKLVEEGLGIPLLAPESPVAGWKVGISTMVLLNPESVRRANCQTVIVFIAECTAQRTEN